jgi:hypothetical protein
MKIVNVGKFLFLCKEGKVNFFNPIFKTFFFLAEYLAEKD